jgi:hypothetical protein
MMNSTRKDSIRRIASCVVVLTALVPTATRAGEVWIAASPTLNKFPYSPYLQGVQTEIGLQPGNRNRGLGGVLMLGLADCYTGGNDGEMVGIITIELRYRRRVGRTVANPELHYAFGGGIGRAWGDDGGYAFNAMGEMGVRIRAWRVLTGLVFQDRLVLATHERSKAELFNTLQIGVTLGFAWGEIAE